MPTANKTKGKRRSTTYRRISYILLVGFVSVGGVFFFRYFWLYHPVGSGPAGPQVSRDVFEKPWINRKVLLVGLGDSITDGLGASPGVNSYFNRLVKNPIDEFPDMQGICLSSVIPNLKAENHGRSGFTSLETLDILLPKLRNSPEIDSRYQMVSGIAV
jgi:hypothetical protein